MSMRLLIAIVLTACLGGMAAAPAHAQIGLPGGGGGLPQLPGGLPGGLPGRLPVDPNRLQDELRDRADRALQAPSRLRDVIRRSDGALEADPDGWPVVRAEIVAVDLSPASRRAALEAGFSVVREERLAELDLAVVVLAPPRRMALARALRRLRELDPDGAYAFNHVHVPAGVVADGGAPAPAAWAFPPQGAGLALGLIDGGVDAAHPALSATAVSQRGFAGEARASPHGTAVASLLVGRAGAFAGAAPGARLYAADVYGGAAAGGASTAVARALAWLAGAGVPVVNVSLVGPRNALVETAVQRAQARGVIVVAAVGNDGPAAPPLYPASYPGVVGVTAVDARGRVLPEAGRGPQVDFAAPGADMAAAGGGRGYVSVRGASFAAPLVAGLLARRRAGSAEAAVAALAAEARDAGARGPDPLYGRGLVAVELRVAPASVGARGSLRR